MLGKFLLSLLAFLGLTNPVQADNAIVHPIINPVSSGESVKSNQHVMIDYSNTDDGYIMIEPIEKNLKLKLEIILNDEKVIREIESDKHAYSLPFGRGNYTIRVFKNIKDSKYVAIEELKFEANFQEIEPYLIPNSVVNFSQNSNAVQLSNKLCNNLENDFEKIDIIYKWITNNINYDFEKAEQDLKWYAPDVDQVIETKAGICMDQAALMCAMLRAQHIPAMLVEGDYEQQPHAWIKVYIDGRWQGMDPTIDIKDIDGDPDYQESRFS